MSIDEIKAAVLELPASERTDVLELLQDSLYPLAGLDPADLEEARRRLDDMKSGRVKGIPAEELLDELDQPAAADLASEAMRIPADERAELADRLIASLCGDEGHDPAWATEMKRRMDEIESGRAETVSEEEFFAGLSARRNARAIP